MAQPNDKVFVIKAEVHELDAHTFTFSAQKTMYGGKLIAAGDSIFLFASENQGGPGLFARGLVASVEHIARKPDLERQTPRVSVTIKRVAKVKRRLGRTELKPFCNWSDDRPQTELNFKLYRQATNKIVGVTASTGAFLRGFF
jgi:hypothetical protein